MLKSETIYPYTSKKKDLKEHESKPMTEKLIRFNFELSFLYEIKNCNVAKINVANINVLFNTEILEYKNIKTKTIFYSGRKSGYSIPKYFIKI